MLRFARGVELLGIKACGGAGERKYQKSENETKNEKQREEMMRIKSGCDYGYK
jgi:hypothetical protein